MRREMFETPIDHVENDETEKLKFTAQTEGEQKNLAYTDKFKEFVRGHPGFLSETKKAVDEMFDKKRKDLQPEQDFDGGKIEYLGKNREANRKFFKITAESGEEFFLKVAPVDHAPADDEFDDGPSVPKTGAEQGGINLLALRKAKEAALDFKDFKLSVIDYQLGYKDAGHSYFLAAYDERLKKTIKDEINSLNKKITKLSDGTKDKDAARLVDLARVRDYLNKLYYMNLYHNKRRAGKAKAKLNGVEQKIGKLIITDDRVTELRKLFDERLGLLSKYFQTLSFFDSKRLAGDLHEANLSYDRSNNEVIVFDVEEGKYADMDMDDFVGNPEYAQLAMSLDR